MYSGPDCPCLLARREAVYEFEARAYNASANNGIAVAGAASISSQAHKQRRGTSSWVPYCVPGLQFVSVRVFINDGNLHSRRGRLLLRYRLLSHLRQDGFKRERELRSLFVCCLCNHTDGLPGGHVHAKRARNQVYNIDICKLCLVSNWLIVCDRSTMIQYLLATHRVCRVRQSLTHILPHLGQPCTHTFDTLVEVRLRGYKTCRQDGGDCASGERYGQGMKNTHWHLRPTVPVSTVYVCVCAHCALLVAAGSCAA
jgi:hypothetical protein